MLIGDQANVHSLAATAVLRRGYHRGPEQATWDESLLFYRRWQVPLVSGAQVTNYRTPQAAPRFDKDWHLIDPAAPLVEPHLMDRVVHYDKGMVRTATGVEHFGDLVILTPGADASAPFGKTTWGYTWVHSDPGVLRLPSGLQVHHWAPYKSIVAGPVGGRARLGSSSASTREDAYKQAQHMLGAAFDIGLINSKLGWGAHFGARLQTKERYHQVAERTWWFGGFHRTGYALAPSLAHQLIKSLEPS